MALADAARRRVILADAPKRHLDASRIASVLGTEAVLPAPSGGGSPVRRYAMREAALATARPVDGADCQ